MDINIFNTHDVLVCRTSNTRDLQLMFTDNSRQEIEDAFIEFLEEHFEPEERDSENNASTFSQFMEETFPYPDEISNQYEMKVYLDVENGFNSRENKNTVEWSIAINEK